MLAAPLKRHRSDGYALFVTSPFYPKELYLNKMWSRPQEAGAKQRVRCSGVTVAAPRSSMLTTGRSRLPASGVAQKGRIRRHRYHIEVRFSIFLSPLPRRGLNTCRDAIPPASLLYFAHGFHVFGFGHVRGRGKPQRERQIRGPDVDAIKSGNGGDLLNPFQALPRLDHYDAQNLPGEVFGIARADHVGRADGPVGTVSVRRITAGRYRALGLGGTIDQGNDGA